MLQDPVKFLHDLSQAAIDAADPMKVVAKHLPQAPKGRIIVIGAGKASASMARAVEAAWGNKDLEGIVVTRYGYAVPCEKIKIVEAAHPVPDEAGEKACQDILKLLDGLTENDLVLCLISGGGSALLSYPAACINSQEKRALNAALLKSGAPIGEMNIVRKHLSQVKGGQLALRAFPAKVHTLIISDVPGDDPATVASGPTLPDPSTQEDALRIIKKYKINVSDDVISYLSDPKNETPKPSDERFKNAALKIISSARDSINAAKEFANDLGLNIIDLGDDLEGESSHVARQHIRLAINAKKPTLYLSGGETTVTIKNESGKGGRNSEYILSAAITAHHNKAIYGIAVDTDGIDGSEDNAGAFFTPETLSHAEKGGLDANEYLEKHDAYTFFDKTGNLVMTGPTFTNVNDFRALLVLPEDRE